MGKMRRSSRIISPGYALRGYIFDRAEGEGQASHQVAHFWMAMLQAID